MDNSQTSWQERVDISHLHRLYTDHKIEIKALGKAVGARLKSTNAFKSCEPELVDIVCEFEALDEHSDIADYCSALDMLFDFGDKNKQLLIETFGDRSNGVLDRKSRLRSSADIVDSFRDKLVRFGIPQSSISQEMFDYMKNTSPIHQDWMLKRWAKLEQQVKAEAQTLNVGKVEADNSGYAG